MIKKIGIIGLGKMGYPIALLLRDRGYEIMATDAEPASVQAIGQEGGITAVGSVEDLCHTWGESRKVIWLMVPSGEAVEITLSRLSRLLQSGDIIVDGGNSFYKDSIRRYHQLKEIGVGFLDCGTSGGIKGARSGACTMIGGDRAVFDICEPLFRDLSVEDGYLYCGPSGSGHFVKMVHNGIEYGMMQAIAEGFEILHRAAFDLEPEKIARLWDHGSVIRGWLMQLTADALDKDPGLSDIRDIAHASGEGRWTLETALELGVPAPVIALSLLMRQRSQQDESFSGKVVAALRREFGGHPPVGK